MRNDYSGICTHTSTRGTRIETFYASGQRGPEVRADGKGGTMARGYYVRTYDKPHQSSGPFQSRIRAIQDFESRNNEEFIIFGK